jgi:hypothetical protein
MTVGVIVLHKVLSMVIIMCKKCGELNQPAVLLQQTTNYIDNYH